MKNLNILAFSIILMGCSGGQGITLLANPNNSAGSNMMGEAGVNENGTTSNGGSQNIAGNSNVSGGSLNNGGANSVGGMTNGGTGGISCTPKVTCESYALSHSSTKKNAPPRLACSQLIDDCGNTIQCGGCPDYYGGCGSATDKFNSISGKIEKSGGDLGIANICGGGCVLTLETSIDSPYNFIYECYNAPIDPNIMLPTSLPNVDCKFHMLLSGQNHANFLCKSDLLFSI